MVTWLLSGEVCDVVTEWSGKRFVNKFEVLASIELSLFMEPAFHDSRLAPVSGDDDDDGATRTDFSESRVAITSDEDWQEVSEGTIHTIHAQSVPYPWTQETRSPGAVDRKSVSTPCSCKLI